MKREKKRTRNREEEGYTCGHEPGSRSIVLCDGEGGGIVLRASEEKGVGGGEVK